MYDAQHRRGHADPDRERDNRDSREHRLSGERPETEAQILHQNVQKITGDRFAAFFFEPLMASELDPRTTLGFPATQSRYVPDHPPEAGCVREVPPPTRSPSGSDERISRLMI